MDQIVRHPRRVVGIWIAVVAFLALAGANLTTHLPTRPVFVDGTETSREHDLARQKFGNQDSLVIMLQGPDAEVRAQGRRLSLRLSAMHRRLVISPWTSDQTLDGLTPRPGVAAIVVNTTMDPDEDPIDALAPLEQRIASTIEPPVKASVGGGGAVLRSFHSAAEEAATAGEMIAIPILVIVLLLVFRSVIAAIIPVIVGGAVVAAGRGVLELSLGVVQLDSFALGALGMMGLALGTDYSLLMVSRFREEIKRQDGDLRAAVEVTVSASSRAIVPAGLALVLAMVIAAQVIPSSLVASAAFVVIIVVILSVASAMLVVPAMLVLVGDQIDRWSLPQWRRHGTARASVVLSRKPQIVIPVLLVLFVLAGVAFTLNTGVAGIELLPRDDSGRQQQEEIKEALGPGWLAPVQVVVDGGNRPVTTPDRLRALAAFQRRVEGDPGVATMAGLAPIQESTAGLDGMGDRIAANNRKLEKGISAAFRGSSRASSEVSRAADGAGVLESVIGSAGGGAASLAEGGQAVGQGSRQISHGLAQAGEGGENLANGLDRARGGSGRLATQLEKAREEAEGASEGGELLTDTLKTGEAEVGRLYPPVQDAERQLSAALKALEGLDEKPKDPEFVDALAAIRSASARLSGVDPSTNERADPAYAGVEAGLKAVGHQLDLGLYLGKEFTKNGRTAERGTTKLAEAATRLEQGLTRLSAGGQELSTAIDRLKQGSAAVSPGLLKLTYGLEHLASGLGDLSSETSGLADGLRQGGSGLGKLSGGLGQLQQRLTDQGGGKGASFERLQAGSPGLFGSGYFYLATLDGSRAKQRQGAAFLVNIEQGGHAARMLVVPKSEAGSVESKQLIGRLKNDAAALSSQTMTDVAVGGPGADYIELNDYFRNESPLLRIALSLISMLILVPVLRSLTMPIVAGLLNLLTVGASFGLLALMFNGSFLGGPGYVDATVMPATIMVMFGLAIDYEVFIFARIREEYVATGSSAAAVDNGLRHTAHVVTGAAVVMIAVFLAFSLSPFLTIRNFGVAQAVGVAIDAFVVRLLVLPAVMRTLGDRAWWLPRWLDRLLPGQSVSRRTAGS